MADIVERLRSHGYPFAQRMTGPNEHEHRNALMDEAADQIEQLRQQLNMLAAPRTDA